MPGRTYPSDPAQAAQALFVRWFGGHYARSTAAEAVESRDGVLRARLTVGRRWSLDLVVLDTLTPAADFAFETARATLEQRLDDAGLDVVLWIPRGAEIPTFEPALSDIAAAIEEAEDGEDGRAEVRRPVEVNLRRVGTTGSVVTVLGGLSSQWAQFTNKVPGSFQLQSAAIHRLPLDEGERDMLMQRVVSAAAQPDIEEGKRIPAIDAWTANRGGFGRAYVLGIPGVENDESAASLRRNLRTLLKRAGEMEPPESVDARALLVLGAATYAEDEKLSWSLKGMDPRLYAAFDMITVAADGVVKPLLQPARGSLPWDAPLG
ncbi:MAG: hypothetical protein KC479_12315 [Dehalococcoidia bacterium]|nr:hypothetical protein [Dehalococcoidia bacterium]MCA9844375.1 hypothetical protein [Dehalococcoidia bacterium]